MKTKLKIMLIALMVIMLITVFTTSVKAEYSAIVTMTPDKTEVNPGDTISVVVNLEDVVDAGTGASEMAGYVEYDSNFIESISSTQGTWATNPETGMFLLSGNILTEDGQFAVLQFKVSENATGSSSVTFTQIITSDGTAEPSSPDITLTFTVADPEDPSNPEDPNNPEDPSNPEDPNNPEDPSDPEDPSNPEDPSDPEDPNNPSDPEDPSNPEDPSDPEDPNNPEEPGEDNTAGGNNIIGGNTNINSIRGNSTGNVATQTKLPYAGTGTGMIIAGVILVVIIIGSYVLYKRYQKI